jgi:acyl-ACP thioesterase
VQPVPTRFEVRSFETDPGGRLTLPALCAFLQEAAWRNAAAMGAGVDLLAERGLAWVLQRLRLEVDAFPRRGEALDVITWAKRWERAVALRDFDVRAPGGERLAAGTSRWVVVDLASRRIVRLPDLIRALPLPERPEALAFDGDGLPGWERADHERRLEVRRADLDAARHVNNARYVEWALEALPGDWLEAHRAARFEIVFRREGLYGDVLVSRAQRLPAHGGGGRFAHALVRARDGERLAEALSEWLPPGAGNE